MYNPEDLQNFLDHLEDPEQKPIMQAATDCYRLVWMIRGMAGKAPMEHCELVMEQMEKSYAIVSKLRASASIDMRVRGALDVFVPELNNEMDRYRRWLKDQHGIMDDKVRNIFKEQSENSEKP